MADEITRAEMNVRENWPIYDTIQIRNDAKEKEGYSSFQALAAIDEVPFFDQRKSDVGIAYTNRDSNEALEFVYNLKKIGVAFRPHLARTPSVETELGVIVGADNPISSALFFHLMDHCGAVLKIREDNKLISTIPLMPEGGGISGFMQNPGWPVVGANNGWPDERNGYWFSGEGIAIPRGATFNVRLRFSTYAKRLLSSLIGPPQYLLNLDPGSVPPPADVKVPACALIRVALSGWRGVQQRGELHY